LESANKVQKHHTQRLEREEVDAPVVSTKAGTKRLALQIDAKYKVTGKYSGQEYLFNGAGSVNDVNEKDVQWMLDLRQGSRQCCGGSPEGNIVFRLAE
jgi:hypothetical protein